MERAHTAESSYVGAEYERYKPCREFDACNELIQTYFLTGRYQECFEGHLKLAEAGYPLAECQVGYFYYEGLGVERDPERAFYWTKRAAEHGDWDAQNNLAELFYEPGLVVERDLEKAGEWYAKAAAAGHPGAAEKCRAMGVRYGSRQTEWDTDKKGKSAP